jgi:alpha-galactosidase
VAFRKSDITYGRDVRIESYPGGRSSNLHLPLLMSLFSEADDSEGFPCGLEWSGLWYMDFRPEKGGRSSQSIGIKVSGLILEPGETLRLPDVHIGFFKGGPSAGGKALRNYIYNHISAKYMKQPIIPAVSYNQWPSEFTFDFLKKQAEMAAKIGVEVYVVDAGWFPGEFPLGVGNWDRTDEKKLPNGLEPLAACVRDLGIIRRSHV